MKTAPMLSGDQTSSIVLSPPRRAASFNHCMERLARAVKLACKLVAETGTTKPLSIGRTAQLALLWPEAKNGYGY